MEKCDRSNFDMSYFIDKWTESMLRLPFFSLAVAFHRMLDYRRKMSQNTNNYCLNYQLCRAYTPCVRIFVANRLVIGVLGINLSG